MEVWDDSFNSQLGLAYKEELPKQMWDFVDDSLQGARMPLLPSKEILSLFEFFF